MVEYALDASRAAEAVGQRGAVEAEGAGADFDFGIIEMVGDAVDGQEGRCAGTLAAFEINALETAEYAAGAGGATADVVENVADVVVEKTQGRVFALNAQVEIFVTETHIAVDVGLPHGAFGHVGLQTDGLIVGFKGAPNPRVTEMGVVEAETGDVEESGETRFVVLVRFDNCAAAGITGKADDFETGEGEERTDVDLLEIDGDAFATFGVGAVYGQVLIGVAQGDVAEGEFAVGEGDVARFDVPRVAVDVESGGEHVEVEQDTTARAESRQVEPTGGVHLSVEVVSSALIPLQIVVPQSIVGCGMQLDLEIGVAHRLTCLGQEVEVAAVASCRE